MNNKKYLKILIPILITIIILVGITILYITNKKYEVNFDSNGGTSVEKQKIKSKNKVSIPKNPTKDGYIFIEWEYEGEKFDFDTKIKKNITLKAKWDKIGENEEVNEPKVYKVVFDTNGSNTIDEQLIEEGQKVIEPKVPTKDGYIFIGWLLDNELFSFDTIIDKDITLVAKWDKETAKTYTVTFNSNGGNKIGNQTIPEGSMAIKPTDPTRNGYKFIGWTLNNKEYSFNDIVSSNITLVAKWEKITEQPKPEETKTYTVTFDSNGGSNINSQSITEGNTASIPSNPTRNGYTFVEWTLNGSTYNFSSKVNSNITLVAKWNKISEQPKPEEPKKYTVTFDSNGGSSINSQSITEGNTASIPSNPTKNGYTFVGWTLNGSTYNFSSKVNSNITLVAKWEEVQKKYTVKVSKVDNYSPDVLLTVFENGTKITVSKILYSDGYELCKGTNTTVNKDDITGETKLIVVLTSGKQVEATIE